MRGIQDKLIKLPTFNQLDLSLKLSLPSLPSRLNKYRKPCVHSTPEKDILEYVGLNLFRETNIFFSADFS